SKLMRHVAPTDDGTFLVEGKRTYTFELTDGQQVKGHDLQKPGDWPWRHSPHAPDGRYAPLRATSPTCGVATIIVLSEPRTYPFYVMRLDSVISGLRLVRGWQRRYWIEY